MIVFKLGDVLLALECLTFSWFAAWLVTPPVLPIALAMMGHEVEPRVLIGVCGAVSLALFVSALLLLVDACRA